MCLGNVVVSGLTCDVARANVFTHPRKQQSILVRSIITILLFVCSRITLTNWTDTHYDTMRTVRIKSIYFHSFTLLVTLIAI